LGGILSQRAEIADELGYSWEEKIIAVIKCDSHVKSSSHSSQQQNPAPAANDS